MQKIIIIIEILLEFNFQIYQLKFKKSDKKIIKIF